jgi:uncharacterized protein (TIGR03382 family)
MRRLVLLLVCCALLAVPKASQAEWRCGPPDYEGNRVCAAYIPLPEAFRIGALQAQDQWCWAASISMIFQHYGFDVSQARVVRDAWGGVVNMPGSPAQIMASINRRWVDDDGRAFSASGDVYSANPVTAIQDLAANRPLIIGSLGHATVLASMTYVLDYWGNLRGITEAYVIDPWPGNGIRLLSPQEWYSTSFLARVRVTASPPTLPTPTPTSAPTPDPAPSWTPPPAQPGGGGDDELGGCSTGGGTTGGLPLALAAVAARWIGRRKRDTAP